MKRSVSRLIIATSALGIAAGTAQAQVASSSDAKAQAGASDFGAEIVVSARKRSETLIEVPVAIAAFDGADLEQRGVRSLEDLQQFTPGFRSQESSSGGATRGFKSFVARGIFPGTDSPDRQVVSIFIDGIPIGGGGSVPGLTDVERVEVVNGPQSAYFGRSTFAGAVNIVTRSPSLTEYHGKVEGSVWNDNSHEISAQLEGPIIKDILSARISLRDWKQGAQYRSFGYGNELGERGTQSAALTLLFKPTDDLSIKFFGSAFRDKDGPPAQGLLLASDYNCNAGAGVGGALNYFCGGISTIPDNRIAQPLLSQADLQTLKNSNTVLGSDFTDFQGFKREAVFTSLAADYAISDSLTFSANGAISRNDWVNVIDTASRYQPGFNTTFIVPYKIRSQSAEARIASDASKPLSFLLGINYFHQEVTFQSNSVRNQTYRPGAAPTYSLTETVGVFGAVSYKPLDGLTVSLEGRWQSDHIGQQALSAGTTLVSGTSRSFTPRAILSYEVTPTTNVYASYSEGTRPVQFNANVYALPTALFNQVQAQGAVPLQVPEERLRMGEVGLKASLFDRKLTLLLAGYYGKWKDRQVAVTITYLNPGATNIPVVLPAGSVELYGMEAQANFRPVRGLTLSAEGAYAETKILQTSCSECASITGNRNPVGNRLPRYPALSGSASAAYESAFGDSDYRGYGRVDLIYTGRMYETEANVAWLKPASRVNARLGVKQGGRFVELFGTNIFNNETPLNISRGVDTYTVVNTLSLAAAQKATYGVRAGMSF